MAGEGEEGSYRGTHWPRLLYVPHASCYGPPGEQVPKHLRGTAHCTQAAALPPLYPAVVPCLDHQAQQCSGNTPDYVPTVGQAQAGYCPGELLACQETPTAQSSGEEGWGRTWKARPGFLERGVNPQKLWRMASGRGEGKAEAGRPEAVKCLELSSPWGNCRLGVTGAAGGAQRLTEAGKGCNQPGRSS
jgi:hypothetical protein